MLFCFNLGFELDSRWIFCSGPKFYERLDEIRNQNKLNGVYNVLSDIYYLISLAYVGNGVFLAISNNLLVSLQATAMAMWKILNFTQTLVNLA